MKDIDSILKQVELDVFIFEELGITPHIILINPALLDKINVQLSEYSRFNIHINQSRIEAIFTQQGFKLKLIPDKDEKHFKILGYKKD